MTHIIAKTGAVALVALLGLGTGQLIDPAFAQKSSRGTPATEVSRPTTMPPQEKAHEYSRSMVQKVQTALIGLGYKLDIDGYVGNQTRAALRQFQEQKRLPVTGEINMATIQMLGVS